MPGASPGGYKVVRENLIIQIADGLQVVDCILRFFRRITTPLQAFPQALHRIGFSAQ
jgi:hypothetical protein